MISFNQSALPMCWTQLTLTKSSVSFPVRFENIKRINGWANLYLHSGLKLYAWCPPRVLHILSASF